MGACLVMWSHGSQPDPRDKSGWHATGSVRARVAEHLCHERGLRIGVDRITCRVAARAANRRDSQLSSHRSGLRRIGTGHREGDFFGRPHWSSRNDTGPRHIAAAVGTPIVEPLRPRPTPSLDHSLLRSAEHRPLAEPFSSSCDDSGQIRCPGLPLIDRITDRGCRLSRRRTALRRGGSRGRSARQRGEVKTQRLQTIHGTRQTVFYLGHSTSQACRRVIAMDHCLERLRRGSGDQPDVAGPVLDDHRCSA